jgi:hypothetical protein
MTMAVERIQFGIDGIGVEAMYDVDHLRFGGVVHVERLNDERRFLTTATERSRPYKIVAITTRQREGYRLVSLVRELYVAPTLAQRVFDAIGGIVPVTCIGEWLRAMVDETSFDQLHDSNFVASSRVKRTEAVLDRLDLVAALERHDVLWMHYRSLVAYLYLTCFDLLGQSSNWIDFGAWLHSKDPVHVAEREGSVADMRPGAERWSTIQEVHAAYNSHYSVRQGFRRFIREILPADTRRNLMASISIQRRVMAPLIGESDPPVELGDVRKIEWLFSFRNQYTHRAVYVPGLHDSAIPPDMRGDEEWWHMADEPSTDSAVSYAVRRWPKILGECVRAGLEAYVGPRTLTAKDGSCECRRARSRQGCGLTTERVLLSP